MAVRMIAKDVIFGTLEVSFGIAALAAMATIGGVYGSAASFRLLISLGVSAPVIPVLMRWSLKYWQSGSMPRAAELIICLWAIVWWLLASIMMIAVMNVRDSAYARTTALYVPAVFSVIAGVSTIVDLILSLKSK